MKNFLYLITTVSLSLCWSLSLAAAQTDDEIAVDPDPSTMEEIAAEELSEEDMAELQSYLTESATFMESLSPKTGDVNLASAGATLHLGEKFYFLNAADSRKVLEDLWGNPPGMDILGMIFEAETTPHINDYAVAVTFDRSGYVSDEDASETDFDKLLKQMKKETRAANRERTRLGYDTVELLGWAAEPMYDAETKRLLWAKSLKFESSETNQLNYNMRFLGRRGVLEFNYIAEESVLDVVTQSMPDMLKVAEYNSGHRYEEFDPAVDQKAAYGVAGLIVGGAVAKKLGILGVLLLFLKKGWFLILGAFYFLRGTIANLFKGNEQA